jgi:hypothetical protein
MIVMFGVPLLAAACGSSSPMDSHNALVSQVQRTRIGSDADYWIEIRNMVGEWERVGLIFGYVGGNGDHEECEKALDGLRRTNPGREYRCTPAN